MLSTIVSGVCVDCVFFPSSDSKHNPHASGLANSAFLQREVHHKVTPAPDQNNKIRSPSPVRTILRPLNFHKCEKNWEGKKILTGKKATIKHLQSEKTPRKQKSDLGGTDWQTFPGIYFEWSTLLFSGSGQQKRLHIIAYIHSRFLFFLQKMFSYEYLFVSKQRTKLFAAWARNPSCVRNLHRNLCCALSGPAMRYNTHLDFVFISKKATHVRAFSPCIGRANLQCFCSYLFIGFKHWVACFLPDERFHSCCSSSSGEHKFILAFQLREWRQRRANCQKANLLCLVQEVLASQVSLL